MTFTELSEIEKKLQSDLDAAFHEPVFSWARRHGFEITADNKPNNDLSFLHKLVE